jgi:hypothetical protein
MFWRDILPSSSGVMNKTNKKTTGRRQQAVLYSARQNFT